MEVLNRFPQNMLFKDVIGNELVKARLIDSVKGNRISHAQLFLGPEGSTKLAAALAYARFVACTDRGEMDSCGKCPSCKKYNQLIHPDLHFVYPVVKTKKFANPVSDDFIKEWRSSILENPYINLSEWYDIIGAENIQGSIYAQESQAIIRKLNLKTFEAEYKVMIIWMPEKMNVTAANKLLKLLEEPPAKTLFILVAEDDEAIISTIRSRVQLVKFTKFSETDLSQLLRLKFGNENSEIETAVKLASGNYSIASAILKGNLSSNEYFENFATLMRLCYTRKVPETVAWVDTFSAMGREQLKGFFEYALRIIRDSFILNRAGSGVPISLTTSEMNFASKFSPFIHEVNIQGINKEFQTAYFHIERNGYSKIVLLDMALNLMKLLKLTNVPAE